MFDLLELFKNNIDPPLKLCSSSDVIVCMCVA